MDALIKIIHLILSVTIGGYIYIQSAPFKKLGESTMEEFNEGEENESDLVNETESKNINYFGKVVFILIGIVVWSLIAITVGKIASEISENIFLKALIYFLMYFIFLRFPFGVTNKMIVKSYDFDKFREKTFFALPIIAFYILAICCYNDLPNFFKWHLFFLN